MDTSLRRRRRPERARATASLAPRPTPGGPGRRILIVAAVAAVVLGVALRFTTSSHLWLDEALTVNIARLPLSRIPDALRHDGSPPLYYLLLHGWMTVFGDGELAARSLSAVFATATLPLIWVAGRAVGARRVAVAALLLLASSPFAIRFATEARMYSLLGLLAMGGYLLLRRFLERPSLGVGAGLAAVSGLLALTHYWSLYLLAAVAIMLAVRAWRAGRAGRGPDTSALLALAAMAGGAVLFVPWLPAFAYQLAHTGTPWAAGPSFSVVIDTVLAWAGGGSDPGHVLNLVFLALAALAVFGIAVDGRHIDLDIRTRPGVRRLAVACAGTLLIALLASVAFNSAYVVRYTSVVFPLFLLVLAFGTLTLADDRVRIGVLTFAVLLGFVAAAPNVGGHRTQAAVIARALDRSARAGDVVAYCPDQLGPSVSRLVSAPVAQVTFPRGTGPQFVDWVDYAARNHAALTAPFARMLVERAGDHPLWLVWSPGYRTLGKCSTLVDRLQVLRPHMKRVIRVSGKYEERMGLIRYDPG